MKTRMLASLTIALLALAGPPLSAQSARSAKVNDTTDVAAVTKVENVLAQTSAIDDVLPFYAPDAVVIDGMYPGLYHGTREIRAGLAPQLAPIKSMKPEILEMNVLTDGQMACAISIQRVTITTTNGAIFHTSFRVQDVLRKIDGKWLIRQQHISYPLDPATGAAVMDGPLVPREGRDPRLGTCATRHPARRAVNGVLRPGQ